MKVPFDQYQRYKTAERLLRACGLQAGDTVLEVGANEHGNLARFLPEAQLSFLDTFIPENQLPGCAYIQGDATALGFADQAFDYIVALDVFEHIPADKRTDFLTELGRVARAGVILSAPFADPAVAATEDRLNSYFLSMHGIPFQWLQEHIDAGLPDLNATISFLQEEGLSHAVLPHGDLSLWEALMRAHFYAAGNKAMQKYLRTIDAFYNQNVYAHDVSSACYRTFLVYSRTLGRDTLDAVCTRCRGDGQDHAGQAGLLRELVASIYTLNAGNTTLAVEDSPLTARLYVDQGDGFFQESSLSAPVILGGNQLAFSLKPFGDIRRLRFDPVNDTAIVRVDSLRIDGVPIGQERLVTNAFCVDEGCHVFVTGDPQMVLEPGQRCSTVQIDFEIKAIGGEALQRVVGFLQTRLGEREAAHTAAVMRLTETESLLAERAENVATMQKSLATAQEGMAQIQDELTATKQDLAEARASLAQNAAYIRRTNVELADRENRLGIAQGRVAALEGSLSWRLSRLACAPVEKLLGHEVVASALRKVRMACTGGVAETSGQPLFHSVEYRQWVKAYDTLTAEDRQAIEQRVDSLAYKPTLSVILPTYNTPVRFLRRAIESVIGQLYPLWELCIADDASTDPDCKALLEKYAQADPRIKLVFRPQNGHISAASNSALELATGEFVCFLDHDDELAEHALYMVAEELNATPSLDLLYSDEDKIDEQGCRLGPHFKTDWNPDLLLSENYVCHLMVMRRQLVERIGGFRLGFEGSQDYDLLLRYTADLDPAGIRHIPHVLYHWRACETSTAGSMDAKPYAIEASRRAAQEYLDGKGLEATCLETGISNYTRIQYPLPEEPPLVSVIIPTKNQGALLKDLVLGLLYDTGYTNIQILVVDHESDEKDLLRFLRNMKGNPKVKVVPYQGVFNYSKINNYAVTQAEGDVFAFLNNDLKIISPEWLTEMVSHALRPEIGVVGAKLYYPNDTIQHAGVILGIGGVAGHSHKGFPRTSCGHGSRLMVIQNMSAVTGACMVMRKDVFTSVGGFDEVNLPIAFNDIDLCLRVQQQGYRVLWTPYAELYHMESASRGYEDTPEKVSRFIKEEDFMKNSWRHILYADPCYNRNLTLEAEDFSLAVPPRVRKPWQS